MALTNCIVVHFQIKRIRPPFHVRHPNSVRISICLYWRYSSDGSQILAPFCGSLVYFSETALTRLIKIKQNMQPQLDFPISTRSLSRFIPISIRRTSLEQNRHKNEMLNLKDKQKRKFPSWATEKMALNILKTKFPRLIRLDSFSVRVNAFLTSLSYENQFRLYQLCLFAPFPVIWLQTFPFVSLTLSGEEEKINTVKDVLNDICGCLFIAIYSIELNELVCALDFAW